MSTNIHEDPKFPGCKYIPGYDYRYGPPPPLNTHGK